jgi:hypothetical protein
VWRFVLILWAKFFARFAAFSRSSFFGFPFTSSARADKGVLVLELENEPYKRIILSMDGNKEWAEKNQQSHFKIVFKVYVAHFRINSKCDRASFVPVK